MTKICLLAGNPLEAERFAFSQSWDNDTWFYPKDEKDLLFKSNFHVLVIGSAGQNIPSSIFERIYQLALKRGKVGRI